MKRSQLGIVQYVIGTRISSKFFSVSVLRFQRFFEVLKFNILFSELIVDEYFIEICRASKSDEVDFQEDGEGSAEDVLIGYCDTLSVIVKSLFAEI